MCDVYACASVFTRSSWSPSSQVTTNVTPPLPPPPAPAPAAASPPRSPPPAAASCPPPPPTTISAPAPAAEPPESSPAPPSSLDSPDAPPSSLDSLGHILKSQRPSISTIIRSLCRGLLRICCPASPSPTTPTSRRGVITSVIVAPYQLPSR
jgi:hypothetical protein